MPEESGLLVTFIRELVSDLTRRREHAETADLIEDMHETISASEANSRRLESVVEAENYLTHITGNPVPRIANLLGVPKAQVADTLTPDRIRALRSARDSNKTPSQNLSDLAEAFGTAPFGGQRDDASVDSFKSKLARFITEKVVPGHRKALTEERDRLESEIGQLEAAFSRTALPSVRDSARRIAKRRNLRSVTHRVVGEAGAVARELAKPSLWFKIADFLQ